MAASPLSASSASFLLSHFSCSKPLHPLLHSPRPAFPGDKCSFLFFFSRNLVSTTILHTREPVLVAKRIQQFNRQPTCKSHHVIKCMNQVCGATGKGTYLALINEDKSNNGESTLSAKTQPRPFHNAFWRFLRPHTVRGTVIGTTALVTRALFENVNLINWLLLPKALSGLLALICGNGYIVGINQIYDVDIDKVNKPFLPIAAGDLSMSAAWILVLGLAAIGIGIVATNFGSLITTLYILGLLLGAMYSVPPLRLKRFPVAAFFVIAMVRGFLLNFGVYYATRASLGLSFQWSPPVAFITIFVTMFAVVIAITKDLPDVEGDVKYNISTFATKLGVRNIALLGSGLLLANYAGAIAFASRMPQFFRPGFMALWHAILAATLVYQTWLLDSSKYTKEAIASFYRFIWNLFYAEYAMFPFL